MKIVYLVKWKQDVEQSAIDTFLEEVPKVLAQGPFTSVVQGPCLKISKRPEVSADWGFIVDLAREDFATWRDSDAHQRLGQVLRPVSGGGTSFEI